MNEFLIKQQEIIDSVIFEIRNIDRIVDDFHNVKKQSRETIINQALNTEEGRKNLVEAMMAPIKRKYCTESTGPR